MTIKAIVFDWDGMVYLEDDLFSKRISRDFSVPLDDILEFFKNDFKSCLEGKADTREILKKYLPKWGWDQGVDKLLEYWFENGTLNEKIIDLIEKLKQKGITCILCTNNEKYRVEYLKEKFGFDKIFDHVVVSSDIGACKPKKEIFDKILEVTKLLPEEIIFCDNREENTEVANSLGFIGMEYTGYDEFLEDLRKLEVNVE